MTKPLKPTPFKLGLLATLVFLSLHPRFPLRWSPPAVDRFVASIDNFIHDTMFRVRGPSRYAADKGKLHAVIVDIDEKSLRALGQWPWPRRIMARILRNLEASRPRAVGFDIVFSEPDRTSLKQLLPLLVKLSGRQVAVPPPPDIELLTPVEREEEIRAAEAAMRRALARVLACPQGLRARDIAMDNDLALARALSASRTAVLGFFFQMSDDGMRRDPPVDPATTNVRPAPESKGDYAQLKRFIGRKLGIPYRAVTNLAMFEDACEYRQGVFNTSTIESGIIRKVPMVWCYRKRPFPVLSLSMLCTAGGGEDIMVAFNREGILNVQIPGHTIVTDTLGRLVVNYRGPSRTFPYVSAVDIVRRDFDPALIRDKYVLVGSSAGALLDLRATPFDDGFPGVEVHANVIDNIMRGDYIRDSNETYLYEWLLMLALGVVLATVLAWARPWVGALFTVLLTGGVLWLGYFLRFHQYQETSSAYPLLVILGMFMVMATLNYFFEGRQKHQISTAFGHYLSPTLVEQLAAHPETLTLAGEQRELSILFSDIRGFTSISERMSAPELGRFLNEYLTPMSNIVMETGGTVDKFMGDAVMAFWGAPLEDEAHAVHAARCALSMRAQLAELNLRWQARGLPEIAVGIGINTGVVSVGNMGSDTRFDYTVMGDNVNLASRLEGLNKQYGTTILISQFTRAAIGSGFFCRIVDLVRVKGKARPVLVYELLEEGEPDVEVRREAEEFERAWGLYRGRDFAGAGKILEGLAARRGHLLYRVYLERIAAYLARPPAPDWDGAFTAKEK